MALDIPHGIRDKGLNSLHSGGTHQMFSSRGCTMRSNLQGSLCILGSLTAPRLACFFVSLKQNHVDFLLLTDKDDKVN